LDVATSRRRRTLSATMGWLMTWSDGTWSHYASGVAHRVEERRCEGDLMSPVVQ
jgi:hypothetical protein